MRAITAEAASAVLKNLVSIHRPYNFPSSILKPCTKYLLSTFNEQNGEQK